MTKQSHGPTSLLKHKFPDAEISLTHQFTTHAHTYQSPVVVANGYASGGGSRTRQYQTKGFRVTIKNTSNRTLSYSLLFTTFKDVEDRIVDRERRAVITDVRPGYTKHEDVDLYELLTEGDGLRPIYLEHVLIGDKENRVTVADEHVLISVFEECEANLTPAQRRARQIVFGGLKWLLIGGVAVAIATAAGFVAWPMLRPSPPAADDQTKQVVRQTVEDTKRRQGPGTVAASSRASGDETSGHQGAHRYLDGSQDESLNTFAKSLRHDGAVQLNSLTMPMLYEVKSGEKLDYTVVVRMGRSNLAADQREISFGLDNPATEQARVDTAQRLLPSLQETYKQIEQAQSYLIPAVVVETNGQKSLALTGSATGFAGGLYCSAGAYELQPGGAIKQACVGLTQPKMIARSDGEASNVVAEDKVFLRVRLSGAFAAAPKGLGDTGTNGVRFANGNGRSVVTTVAPVSIEAVYKFDRKTATITEMPGQ